MIKDSGDRHEFESGAVRDMQEGKGRCDLMPMKEVAQLVGQLDKSATDEVLDTIACFQITGEDTFLGNALMCFLDHHEWDLLTMLLEVAIHFEQGAEKYGENNWQKGLPVKSYINSAVRHYLKWLRGDNDEPHDRAFCWNILCAMWTCRNHPHLNSYGPAGGVYLNDKQIAEGMRKLSEYDINYGKGRVLG